jgi:hypothetical protein
MNLFHERLLAEIVNERRWLPRRSMLTGSLKVAGGAAMAMSLTTMPRAFGHLHLVAAKE